MTFSTDYTLERKKNEGNKKKEEVKESKAELENLANIIKQAMFEDYKLAYSEEGDAHKEEAESIVMGNVIKREQKHN